MQVGLVEFVKASKINKPMTGHFAKSSVPPVRIIKEFSLESAERCTAGGVKAGDQITGRHLQRRGSTST